MSNSLPFSIEFLTTPHNHHQTSCKMIDLPPLRSLSPISDSFGFEENQHQRRTPSPLSLNGSLDTPSKSIASSCDSPRSAPSPTGSDDVAETIFALEQQAASIQTRNKDKPGHSYIALISMAILSRPDRRMVLNDIYEYIMTNFAYYNNSNKAWRNSVRHNLSLNECFVKCGRAENGKGNYWAIHQACVDDFARGDFRRRNARRRARRGTRDLDIPEIPVNSAQKYNVGYVQMSCPPTYRPSSYHPYRSYQQTGYNRYAAMTGTSSCIPQLAPAAAAPALTAAFSSHHSRIVSSANTTYYTTTTQPLQLQLPFQNW
ncbi:uncharacterized protein LOC141905287 [Tubulanus polymorphus]|uniref:uncharacterized protein LOC141905287 n=1 Tax=Tubulanus polymorphus TaxID=672921 RepID=UPI003DA5A5EE